MEARLRDLLARPEAMVRPLPGVRVWSTSGFVWHMEFEAAHDTLTLQHYGCAFSRDALLPWGRRRFFDFVTVRWTGDDVSYVMQPDGVWTRADGRWHYTPQGMIVPLAAPAPPAAVHACVEAVRWIRECIDR